MGFKYVYCRHDPAMLFDLNKDPNETNNLAGDSQYIDIQNSLHALVMQRWEYNKIEKEIVQSQKRRLFVQEAILKGTYTSWDYQPENNAARQYVRGAVDPNTTATKSKKRLPFVEEIKPHNPRNPDEQLDMS